MLDYGVKEFWITSKEQATRKDGSLKFDDNGEPVNNRFKSRIGFITSEEGNFKQSVTITKFKGSLRFTSHTYHWEPTAECMEGDELVPDYNTVDWVEKSHRSLNEESFDAVVLKLCKGDVALACEVKEMSNPNALVIVS